MINIDVYQIIKDIQNLSPNTIFAISKRTTYIAEKEVYFISLSEKKLLAKNLADRLGKSPHKRELVQTRYARDFAIAFHFFDTIFYGGDKNEITYLEEIINTNGSPQKHYSSFHGIN